MFGFAGDDREQAALLSEMAGTGLELKTFQEEQSSFEDILVEVAERNRKE